MEEKNEVVKVHGDVSLRKERRKRQKLLLTQLFLDYAQNSTLHGLRYIAERGLHFFEKVFWIVTFIFSCVLCFLLINNVWVKWKTSPVIVSFSEEVISVAKVPFPSVTICPEMKVDSSKFNYTGTLSQILRENATQEEIQILLDVSLVCSELEEIEITRSIGNLPSSEDFINSSLVHNLFKVAPGVKEVFEYCMWRGKYLPCENMFKIALTTEGVCYNFNALAATEMFTDRMQKDYPILNTTEISRNWTVIEGYTNNDEHPYPRRGRENGPSPDLVILLQEAKTFRGSGCNSARNGFKIFLQNPEDLPQSSHYYYAAVPKQVSSIAVKFSMLNTSETLRGYDPEVRQCYFPEDYKLDYFEVYTPSNCRLECQSEYTFRRCGCVWFNMPHVKGTPICTGQMWSCVHDAQDELAMGELKADLGLPDNGKACRCLPSCYSIQYDAEILKTGFDVQKYFKHLEVLMEVKFPWINDYEHSRVEIYFKEPRFVSMRRSELFGLTDFLANVGGLLGLFLGFSLLSLVEIVYFVTLRLCCIFKRDLRQEKSNFEVKDEKLS